MGRIERNIARCAAVAALPLIVGCAENPTSVAPAAPAAPTAEASATPSATPVDPKVAGGARAAAATVKIAEKDAGKTIDAHVGDTIELTLATNPTTGYDWQVDRVDRTLGQPTIARADGSTKAVGAGTTMTFTWKLIGVGAADPADHVVELAYRRPWEKGDPPEQTFKFTLHVAR